MEFSNNEWKLIERGEKALEILPVMSKICALLEAIMKSQNAKVEKFKHLFGTCWKRDNYSGLVSGVIYWNKRKFSIIMSNSKSP